MNGGCVREGREIEVVYHYFPQGTVTPVLPFEGAIPPTWRCKAHGRIGHLSLTHARNPHANPRLATLRRLVLLAPRKCHHYLKRGLSPSATALQDLTLEGLGLEFTDIHTQPSYFSQQSEVPGHYNLGGGNAGGG